VGNPGEGGAREKKHETELCVPPHPQKGSQGVFFFFFDCHQPHSGKKKRPPPRNHKKKTPLNPPIKKNQKGKNERRVPRKKKETSPLGICEKKKKKKTTLSEETKTKQKKPPPPHPFGPAAPKTPKIQIWNQKNVKPPKRRTKSPLKKNKKEWGKSQAFCFWCILTTERGCCLFYFFQSFPQKIKRNPTGVPAQNFF